MKAEEGVRQEVVRRWVGGVGAPLCSQLPQFWLHPAHPFLGVG